MAKAIAHLGSERLYSPDVARVFRAVDSIAQDRVADAALLELALGSINAVQRLASEGFFNPASATPGQAICPRNRVRRIGKSYTIGVAKTKPDVPQNSCAVPRVTASIASRMRSTLILVGPASMISPKPLRSENRM